MADKEANDDDIIPPLAIFVVTVCAILFIIFIMVAVLT